MYRDLLKRNVKQDTVTIEENISESSVKQHVSPDGADGAPVENTKEAKIAELRGELHKAIANRDEAAIDGVLFDMGEYMNEEELDAVFAEVASETDSVVPVEQCGVVEQSTKVKQNRWIEEPKNTEMRESELDKIDDAMATRLGWGGYNKTKNNVKQDTVREGTLDDIVEDVQYQLQVAYKEATDPNTDKTVTELLNQIAELTSDAHAAKVYGDLMSGENIAAATKTDFVDETGDLIVESNRIKQHVQTEEELKAFLDKHPKNAEITDESRRRLIHIITRDENMLNSIKREIRRDLLNPAAQKYIRKAAEYVLRYCEDMDDECHEYYEERLMDVSWVNALSPIFNTIVDLTVSTLDVNKRKLRDILEYANVDAIFDEIDTNMGEWWDYYIKNVMKIANTVNIKTDDIIQSNRGEGFSNREYLILKGMFWRAWSNIGGSGEDKSSTKEAFNQQLYELGFTNEDGFALDTYTVEEQVDYFDDLFDEVYGIEDVEEDEKDDINQATEQSNPERATSIRADIERIETKATEMGESLPGTFSAYKTAAEEFASALDGGNFDDQTLKADQYNIAKSAYHAEVDALR